MSSWFDDSIDKHRQELAEEERKREDARAKAEQERDEFRAGFELAVENTLVPTLEGFVEDARRHGFTASHKTEADAQGRLRAVMAGIYANDDREVSGGGMEHCLYKVTLQMNTRRIAHMMTYDNVPGAERKTQNEFLDLDSLAESAFQERLREFLQNALRYCQGPH